MRNAAPHRNYFHATINALGWLLNGLAATGLLLVVCLDISLWRLL